MNSLQERKYKETSPEKTVKLIKEILKNLGIEVEENWINKSCVGTYSLRLCVKGTNIGQNGKGMTKEFARASAYAEFLERYQNGILVFRQEKPTEELPFVYAPDEKKLSVKEIVKQEDSFINQIFNNNNFENSKTENSKIEFFSEMLGKDRIKCLPYYSIKDKSVVYIPHVLSCHLYGTNGMCAGNSPEEAIIEGISEILERYVSVQIIYKRISLPEIPDSYLEDFPKVKNMLEKLRKKEGYICKLVDCSLGGIYPVAGLIILEKNTGKFGFKLGAHPDYSIAMERCFTEAAQGMNIYKYSQSCIFNFKNDDIDKSENIKKFYYANLATMPYQMFDKEKTYEFTKMPDVSNLSNKEILRKLIASILKDGYDVLVRDVSTLGFPSFRIIIPGMTEMTHAKMAGEFKIFEEIEYLLKDLNRINLSNIKRVIEIMETEINELGETSLYSFMNVKDTNLLPCENIGNGTKYFLAICYIMNGDYDKAEKILEEILFIATNFIPNDITTIVLKSVYYYASGMKQLGSHDIVMEYINLLFDSEIASAIDESFKNRENIIMNHYNIKPEDYVENDDSYYLPFMKVLKNVQKENIIQQQSLGTVLVG